MPMIWVLGGLAAAELLIVHLLVSMWNGTAAWVLTLLTIAAVAQAAWMVRAMITRPVLVGERAVTIRFRTRTPIMVPVEDIVRVEDSALAPAPTGSGVFRGTLLAHPNVTLRLERPLAHAGRRIEVIALRIDAPEAFRPRSRRGGRSSGPAQLKGRRVLLCSGAGLYRHPDESRDLSAFPAAAKEQGRSRLSPG